MSGSLLFVLLIGTSYRVVRLVQTDTIFARQRERFFDRFPPTVERANTTSVWDRGTRTIGFKLRSTPGHRPSILAKIISCSWCLGVYVSAALIVAIQPWASTPLPLLWWGAVATGIGVLSAVAA